MKRLDKLIISELVGPWLFGVGIFTVLVMAGTYLFKLTDYVVQGVQPATLVELTFLLLPGIMSKTFAMAMLLAALLSFGRLSSDSEIVALRAAGASIFRIMIPVAMFSAAVSALCFVFNETVVPSASLRATIIQGEIAKKIDIKSTQPILYPQYEKGKLVAIISASDFNYRAQILRGVNVVTYDEHGNQSYVMLAKELEFHGPKDWRVRGGGTVLSATGLYVSQLNGDAWPSDVPVPDMTPKGLVAKSLNDLDSLSLRDMRQQIEAARLNPAFGKAQIANLEFGYFNKIALPLAAFVYGLLGAPLGIRNHRTGAAAGFWIAVIIIFSYLMLANLMAVYAQGGVVPSFVASFLPIAIGLSIASVLIWKRNG